jgi:hypothetical protein
MRAIDPNAAQVLVPGPEYRGYAREAARLDHQIAEEMGQLPQRVGKLEIAQKNRLASSDVIAQDENGHWYSVRQ